MFRLPHGTEYGKGETGHVARLTKIVVKTSELSLAKMAPAHMLLLLSFTLLLADVRPCKSLGYGFVALFPTGEAGRSSGFLHAGISDADTGSYAFISRVKGAKGMKAERCRV